ncbi:GTPase IMAP family member 5-like [Tautogolabrus adspersus]
MDPRSDLTIILLGNSGVGKSASGNTILQHTAFESRRSFAPVTKEISMKRGTVFGKQISVVDTPGIFGSEDVIKSYCQGLLKSSAPCLFLVLVKIDRFTIEQKNAVEAAVRVVGDQLLNSYLLFTQGDNLCSMSLEDFVNEDPEGPLVPLAQRFEGRHHVFINNENGGPEQVKKLLEKSGHLANPQPAKAPPTRIVLLGLPGVGKSFTGNTILGSEKFESAGGFNSVSTKTVSESATVEGRQVTVVDTPGLSGRALSPKQLYLEIMSSIQESEPGPHAFMIVVRISRITEVEIKLFELVQKLFGKDAMKYVMVLFTYGDELRGGSISDMIKGNTSVRKLVSECNNRFCVFDNTARGNREQVRNLLRKIDVMVRANGGKHYTAKMFNNALSTRVNISIMWEDVCDWFKKLLQLFDESRGEAFEYARMGMV